MSKVEVGDWVLFSEGGWDFCEVGKVIDKHHKLNSLWVVEEGSNNPFLVPLEIVHRYKKTKEELMQFKPGQRVKLVTSVETLYGKYLGPAKDIVGGYADAKIETDEGRTVRVKKKFVRPVEEETPTPPNSESVQSVLDGLMGVAKQNRKKADSSAFSCSKECEPCSHNEVCDTVVSRGRRGRKGFRAGGVIQNEPDVYFDIGEKPLDCNPHGPDFSKSVDWLDDILRSRGNREVRVEDDYQSLFSVLMEGLDQAQFGKGRNQHSAGEDFVEQEICETTRAVGLGFPLGQSRKKCRESLRILEQKGSEAAKKELLGAIVYIAAACIILDEKQG